MEIRVLRYFLAVAREQNITRAAESLHLSQPALSKQLMELEQELGKQLLVRGKRKITLTQEGILLRKRAEEILELVDKTEQEISAESKPLSGKIFIGGKIPASLLRTGAVLRRQHHGVYFGFYSSDATDITERLDHGSLDFAVLLPPIDAVQYESIPMPEVSCWGMLVQADSPLADKKCIRPADLIPEPIIIHRRAGLQQMIAQWAQTEPEQLNIAATYNVIAGSTVTFVESGLGSLLITRDLLDPELGSSVQFLPLDPPLETRYRLVWKKNATLSKPAERFLEMLKAQ